MKRLFWRLVCLVIDHKRVGDDTWGGYGWTCPRCGENDCCIHDM
jgi:hypothetical protein